MDELNTQIKLITEIIDDTISLKHIRTNDIYHEPMWLLIECLEEGAIIMEKEPDNIFFKNHFFVIY